MSRDMTKREKAFEVRSAIRQYMDTVIAVTLHEKEPLDEYSHLTAKNLRQEETWAATSLENALIDIIGDE